MGVYACNSHTRETEARGLLQVGVGCLVRPCLRKKTKTNNSKNSPKQKQNKTPKVKTFLKHRLILWGGHLSFNCLHYLGKENCE